MFETVFGKIEFPVFRLLHTGSMKWNPCNHHALGHTFVTSSPQIILGHRAMAALETTIPFRGEAVYTKNRPVTLRSSSRRYGKNILGPVFPGRMFTCFIWCGFQLEVLTPESHRVLKPGGWLQCVEFYYNIQSDNGSLTDNHALRQYSSTFLRAMEGKKDLRAALRLEAMMRDAGLVEIGSRMIPLPLNGWSQSEYKSYLPVY